MKRHPILYVIAGSNGAGKTTFATKFLPRFVGKVDFVNADLIAKGLSPFDPQSVALDAGRIVLERIAELSRQGVSFAIETTLSGRTYGPMFASMRERGYQIHIYFLWIPGARLALQRIRKRVRRGGHDIPPADVKRRFGRLLQNLFQIYQYVADRIIILDNSKAQPRTVAERRRGRWIVRDSILYHKILSYAKNESK